MTTDDPRHPAGSEPGPPAEGVPATPSVPGEASIPGAPSGPGATDDPSGPSGSTSPPRGDEPATVDDLASALVDVALTPDEAEAARQRPEVRARAGEMDAIRLTIRTAVPDPDPVAREHAIAAALAAFDADASAPGVPLGATVPPLTAQGSGVTDLAARRDRADAPHRRAPRWLGAVAAIAVVVAGVAGVVAVSSQGSDDADTAMVEESTQSSDPPTGDSAEDSAEDGADESAGAVEEPRVPPPAAGDLDDHAGSGESGDDQTAAMEVPPREAGDLGVLPSANVLVARMSAQVDDQAAVSPEAGGVTSAEALDRLYASCPDRLRDAFDDPSSTLRLHARAEVDRRPVDAWVIDTPEGRRVLAVDASCRVVVDREAR